MTHRVVFIGTGGRGRSWVRNVTGHPRFKPVAFVDPSSVAHDAMESEFKDLKLKGFKSVADASDGVDADIAIIAASSFHRKGNGIDALGVGWHILVEKPFSLCIADARAIVELGDKKDRIVSVGQNYRFRPEVATMRDMIFQGNIGDIGHGVFVRHRKRYAGKTYQKNMIHNYLWEMGVHDLDVVRHTLGLKPLRVTGSSFLPPWGDYDGETTVSAVYEFENGVQVNYFGAWASHIPELHWRIDGSLGSLRMSDGLEVGNPGTGEWQVMVPPESKSFRDMDTLLDQLDEAITTGSQTSTSGRDNLWTIGMLEGVVRSTESGGPVSITDLVAD